MTKTNKQIAAEFTKKLEHYKASKTFDVNNLEGMVNDIIYLLGVSISDEYSFANGYSLFIKKLVRP